LSSYHEGNRKNWNAKADEWRALRVEDGVWERLRLEPELAFQPKALEVVRKHVGPLEGRSVCVLASGDNYAAFALGGLGAEVTSIDISGRQLEIAADRARAIGLSIEFVQADITDMPHVSSGRFDLACATNGTNVWLSDLGKYYAEVFRILRRDGRVVSCDVHPFQRPWEGRLTKTEIRKPYWDTGPYESHEVVSSEAGAEGGERCTEEVTCYNFHWTVADTLNALAASGLLLSEMREEPDAHGHFWTSSSYALERNEELLDWRKNPLAGLPVWLMLVAQKA